MNFVAPKTKQSHIAVCLVSPFKARLATFCFTAPLMAV